LKCFVANRVADLQETASEVQWRHVPTDLNPADLISRGVSAQDLPHTMWYSGSMFLRQSTEKWPNSVVIKLYSSEFLELRPKVTLKIQTQKEPFIDEVINKYSSFHEILRIFSYIFRLANGRAPDRNLIITNIVNIPPTELSNTFYRPLDPYHQNCKNCRLF